MISLKYLPNIVSFTIVFIAIFSIQPYTNFPIGNTAVWWIINGLILFIYLFSKFHYYNQNNSKGMIFISLYLLYNIFSLIRGGFVAESYWDWKGLFTNAMALLLPIVAYTITNLMISQKIMRYYMIFALPLFIIFSFIITTDSFGFYLIPISFLLLFLPVLTPRWKVFIMLLSVLVIVVDLGARSNVIKFGLPALFVLLYYTRKIFSKSLLEVVRNFLFMLPFLFFYLGVTKEFNIFNLNEYLELDSREYEMTRKDAKGEISNDNLAADTRTFLYEEVLQTAQKHNTWWIGRSPARGNETTAFAALAEISGREERLTNEVAILNVFTWTGLIGIILYFLVFYQASYLALNHSNNFFSKILALVIAFHWVYAWVEDINIFSLNYFLLWFILGIAISKEFRLMNDLEVKYWIQGVFTKDYKVKQVYLNTTSE